MNDIAFVEFPKMPRWSRDVIITEKIDGTNACVFTDDDGNFLTGSRTRWITPDDDNHGFSLWAHAHREELQKALGPGRHFGEWWGSGIQRGYGLPKGEKRFSLFNVGRWYDPNNCLGEDIAERRPVPPCCRVVPILVRGPNAPGVIQQTLEVLRLRGSYAAPGFMNPEGVVLFHVAANLGFKKTLEKDEVPKGLVKP